MSNIDALLNPTSIALVGASPDKESFRGRLVSALLQHPFPGSIFLVNPSHREIAGLECLPSVDELPRAVDLAIIATPAKSVPGILESCGARGVRGVLIVSSGFADEHTREGTEREKSVAAIAAKYGMAVCGPNSEGFLNGSIPLAASFSPAVVGDESYEASPTPGLSEGVALISQSGGVGFGIYSRARSEAMRFTHVIATGNQASLEAIDYLDYVIGDPQTRVAMLFVEGFKNPKKFSEVAAGAARARKPIIVSKVGRSGAGARAVASHTGALAGSHDAYEAVFRKHGLAVADSADQMIDIARGFAYFPDCLPKGRRVCILTPSGGAGIWASDVSEAQGLVMPPLDEATQKRLLETLPPYAAVRNPVDVTAQGIVDHGYAMPLAHLLESPTFDAVVVLCSGIRPNLIEADLEALRVLRKKTGIPVLFCSYTRRNPRVVQLLAEAGFPCMESIDNATRALVAMADYQSFLSRNSDEPDREEGLLAAPDTANTLFKGSRKVLCEYEAKAALAAVGICRADCKLARSEEEAVAHFEEIGGAVALKVQSPDIPHKTDAGGVALALNDPEAVSSAFRDIVSNARAYKPTADIHGVLVEPMAEGGVEMIVGIERDADFGLMLLVGCGGVFVEILNDVAISPLPISKVEAGSLIERLRGKRLLAGERGAEPADVDALKDLLVSLSRFADLWGDCIGELDLNPVVVHARGRGLTIADALIVRHEARHR